MSPRTRLRIAATVSLLALAHGASAADAKARRKLDDNYIPFTGEEFVKRVSQSDKKIVELFLQAGFAVDTPDEQGYTALRRAADQAEGTMLAPLLAAGADLKAKTRTGETPLHGANNHGSVPFVQALLAARADVNARNGRGETALFEAARNDHAELIAVLLKAGADPALADGTGVTPLSIAKQVGSMRATELLKVATKEAKP